MQVQQVRVVSVAMVHCFTYVRKDRMRTVLFNKINYLRLLVKVLYGGKEAGNTMPKDLAELFANDVNLRKVCGKEYTASSLLLYR